MTSQLNVKKRCDVRQGQEDADKSDCRKNKAEGKNEPDKKARPKSEVRSQTSRRSD